MPRFTSVKQRQLVTPAPDQTKERVSARLEIFSTPGGFNGTVWNTAQQPDLRIVVASSATDYAGDTVTRVVRINADGSRDTAFTPSVAGLGINNVVYAVALQSDGKIVIGGDFERRVVRLNADGTEDTAFTSNLGTQTWLVRDLVIQSDGKILVCGGFGGATGLLRRINADGTLDASFNSNIGANANATVRKMRVQTDGKIVAVGDFTTFSNQTRNRMVRRNADGTDDTAFYTNLGSAFQNIVWTIDIQSDGKILAGGSFGVFDGVARAFMVRLNTDGTEDTAFYANLGTGFGDRVTALSLDASGKIIAGGNYTTLNGNARLRMVRLNTDGTEDTDFYTNLGTGPSATVWSARVLADERILIGGEFTAVNSQSAGRLARLDSSGAKNPNSLPVVTYALSSADNVNEGTALTVTVNTANVTNGTVLTWRILDKPEDFAVSAGTVTVNSNTATITVTPLEDLFTEGSETFRVELSRPTGTVLTTSSAVTINDTSTG